MIRRFDPAADPRAWWRNQVELHPPQSPEVGRAMDSVRCWFRSLGDMMIDTLPPGPDTTVALRALKEASMHAIGAIACNQWHWEDDAQAADVTEVDRPMSYADAAAVARLLHGMGLVDDDRRIGAGFVSTAAGHPCWSDGAPIMVGHDVEVVDRDGQGWSGRVVSVADDSACVAPVGDSTAGVWCDPSTLIRRGTGKAEAT